MSKKNTKEAITTNDKPQEIQLTAEQKDLMEKLVREGMRLERVRVLKILEAMPASEDLDKLGQLIRGAEKTD